MTDIKYKIWDSQKKVMGLFPNQEGMGEIADFRGMTNVYEFSYFFQNSDRYIFRQCLGVKDDCGEDIYSGDVIFFSVKKGVGGDPEIYGVQGVATITPYGPGYGGWKAIFCEKAKRIGNIYEHPHLLEATKC